MATSEDSDSFIEGMVSTVRGETRVRQDGENMVVESPIQADDALGSPVAKTAKEARQDIQEDSHDTIFDLYDAIVDLDGELSGAVNAIAQSATYNQIMLPEDDPSSTEEEILEDCRELAYRINGREFAIDVLRNLIKYGNDMNKKVYNGDNGIIEVQSLPINSMSIVGDRDDLVESDDMGSADLDDILFQVHPELDEPDEEIGGNRIQETFERDAYVLNEAAEEGDPSVIEPHNLLHFSIGARSNWFEDRVGRTTYGVWGQSRIEPLKFTIQTKYNTLINKVAMDDKLLAREVYYIDTQALFGDIQDREDRISKAREYADDVANMLQDLEADERPILPDHVDVEVIGPEGKAIDQKPFIEQLNNGIAAALTFPMAGLGRGTTSVKAGEEISSLWAENNIKNLRRAVIRGFEELFSDHIKLRYPDLVKNHSETDNIGEMKLDPDVTIPTLEYEPFRQEDRSELVDQTVRLVDIGIISRREAREMLGKPTDDESMAELSKSPEAYGSDSDDDGSSSDDEEDEEDNEGDEDAPSSEPENLPDEGEDE